MPVEKRGVSARLRRHTVLCYLAVVAVVTLIGILRFEISDSTRTYHYDYDIYRAGGRGVLDGVDLYLQSFHANGIHLPFTYPPLSALVFVPLALIPIKLGYVLFTALSLLALAATVGIVLGALAREAGRQVTGRQLTLAALVSMPVAVWVWPVTHTLEFGQINIILMVLVVADLLLPRTPWPRGMMIGIAAALKLTPAVFGLYFLLSRQWRAAVTSIVSGIVVTALAWLVLPGDSRRYWTETLNDPSRIGDLRYAANQSLRGTVARYTGDPLQTTLWFILAVVTVVAVVVVMLRLISAGAAAAAVSTNALLALLASPVSWAHHWVWLVPMLLVVGVSLWSRRRTRREAGTAPVTALVVVSVLAAVLVAVSTLLPVHVYLPSARGVEQDWSALMKVLGSEMVVTGVLWLVAAGLFPRMFRPAAPVVQP